MTRLASRARAFAPDPAAPQRCCDMPGCGIDAAYRAPKSRDSLNEYWWFCLDHVRLYNARWDFYKGMSSGQIEQELRLDAGWQRPTWPLGRLGGKYFDAAALDAMLDTLGRPIRPPPGRPAAPADLRQPLDTLGLAWPIDLATLKTRYKLLAKQNHPDANGGDRAAEERLKRINLAYATLRARLRPDPPAA